MFFRVHNSIPIFITNTDIILVIYMKNSTVLIFSLRKVYFGYQILQGFQLIFGIAATGM